MSQPTSDSKDIDRKAALNRRRRTNDERASHFKKHKFKGLEFKVSRAPLLMPINAETPPVVVLMWTYLCVLSLTIGWFACSFFGYHLCRMWRNIPAPGEGANLEFIFTAQPLNRWAVNLVVSFGMLLFFASQSLIFVWRRAVANRERQNEFAHQNTWIDPSLEKGRAEIDEPEDNKERGRGSSRDTDADAKRAAAMLRASLETTKNHQIPKDESKPSTHIVSASRPDKLLVTHNDPPPGQSAKSTTNSSRTPVDDAELARRRRKGQPSSVLGCDESARAAEKSSSKPSATIGISDRAQEQTALPKDSQKQSSGQLRVQFLPVNDATADRSPVAPARNGETKPETKPEATSSTNPKPPNPSSNDNAQAPQTDKPNKSTTTPPPSSSNPEANPKHFPKPDNSQDPPSDPSQKDVQDKNPTTTSQTPGPDPASTTPPKTSHIDPTTSEDIPVDTLNERTTKPIKPILKGSSSPSGSE